MGRPGTANAEGKSPTIGGGEMPLVLQQRLLWVIARLGLLTYLKTVAAEVRQ